MPKKILVVDDEPDILRIISFRLKSAGYNIITAVNGREAIDLIRGNKPDLVLLDLLLPGLGGYDVCKIVKKDKEINNIPIIILSAGVSNESLMEVKKLGIEDYIIKPFDSSALLLAIEKALKKDDV